MHLRYVEIFCDVASRRSFSKGAAAQNVSQSAASQAVLVLEKLLGARLIDRSQRPLALTAAGRVYFEGCRELLQRYRALEDRVRRTQDMVVGTVRVAAIYSVGLMQMEAYVQKFEEQYPDAHLRIDYVHPDEVYSRLQRDEADLGLVSFPRSSSDIAVVPWQDQRMVLVVPPSHQLARQSTVTLSDLEGAEFIGFTEELTIRREVDRWLRKAKVSVQIVHVFDNIDSIKSAIEDGSGISLLPEPTVWRETGSGTLVSIPLSDVQLTRPVGIVHRHKHLTTPAAKLIDLLCGVERGADPGVERSGATGDGATEQSDTSSRTLTGAASQTDAGDTEAGRAVASARKARAREKRV